MPAYSGELLGASADPFETDVSLLEARVDALEGAGGVGGAGAPANAAYIVQIPNGGLSAEQALSVLATGLLKSTTASGVLSIAVAGVDYLAPDAGLAEIAALSTTPFGRALLTQSDLSALQDVLQISDVGLSGSFEDLLAKPTTIAGYGITDAAAVGGMDTQVQFNDGGVQAGSADLIFSKGPGRLTVFELVVTNLLTSINTSFQGNIMIGPGGSIIIRPGANITNASSIGVPDEAGTGTATVAPAGTAVVGTGTLFTTEFAVGAAIKLGDQVHAIAAIADNTHLTLSTPNISGATAVMPLIQGNLWELKNPFGTLLTYIEQDGRFISNANMLLNGDTATVQMNGEHMIITMSPLDGSVIISPDGNGTVTINPNTGGSINNLEIGDETPQDGHFLVLTATNIAGLGTGTPDATTFLRGDGTWNTPAGGASAPFIDSTAIIKGSADATKLLRLEVDGFTTATTRVLTPPDYDGQIATLAGPEALTNKSIVASQLTGDIAVARINSALTAPGPIGSVTPGTVAATTLTTTGSVGIGADASLEIESATYPQLNIDSSGNAGLTLDKGATATAADLIFQTAGVLKWALSLKPDASENNFGIYDASTASYVVNINAGGNFGIGTAAPGSKLSINGGLHVGGDADAGDNNLLVDGTIIATGGVTIGAGGVAITKIRFGISAAMVIGVVTITDTEATANTRYFLSCAALGTVAIAGTYSPTARSNGASVTCTSSQPTETSTLYWLAFEP